MTRRVSGASSGSQGSASLADCCKLLRMVVSETGLCHAGVHQLLEGESPHCSVDGVAMCWAYTGRGPTPESFRCLVVSAGQQRVVIKRPSVREAAFHRSPPRRRRRCRKPQSPAARLPRRGPDSGGRSRNLPADVTTKPRCDQILGVSCLCQAQSQALGSSIAVTGAKT